MVEDQGIETLDDLPNERDWMKTFDGIDEFFHKCYGITSIHLAYIIRKDSTPKENEDTDMYDPLEQMIESPSHFDRGKWHHHQTSHFCDRQEDAF